jgi:hypothetical protein
VQLDGFDSCVDSLIYGSLQTKRHVKVSMQPRTNEHAQISIISDSSILAPAAPR